MASMVLFQSLNLHTSCFMQVSHLQVDNNVGLNDGLVVARDHVTPCSRVSIQRLSDRKTIRAVETVHLIGRSAPREQRVRRALAGAASRNVRRAVLLCTPDLLRLDRTTHLVFCLQRLALSRAETVRIHLQQRGATSMLKSI